MMNRNKVTAQEMYRSIVQNKKKWRGAIGAVSILLALSIVVVLILPAIAMEDDTFCGIEEHIHNESCYEKVLDCDLEEGKDHQHDERCYKSVLICDKTEHTHSLACYSDPEADKETAEDWERSMEHIDLSSNSGAVLADIAKSQLGYKESEKNYTVINDSETHGYTRYGEWYSDPYGKWSGMFAAFCIHYAGITDYPVDSDCNDWADKLRQAELFYEADEVEPEIGDLVFLNTEAGERADAVGIITEIEEDDEETSYVSFKSVEGIPSEGVQLNEHSANDSAVIGFGLLPEHKAKIEKAGEDNVLLSVNTDTDILVTVKADASAFEEDAETLKLSAAELVGKDIDDNLNGYMDLIREKSEIKEMQNPVFRVFKIGLTSNDNEVVPLKSVQTAFGGMGESRNISVYSLADESAERVSLLESEDSSLLFDTDRFGTFIVISDVYSQNRSIQSGRSPVSTDETTSLEVQINWEDGKYAHQDDTVTLKLLKNGEETGDTAEVTADDKWTYTFTGLDKPKASESFAYTVEEELPDDNINVTVSDPEKVEAADGDTYWLPARDNELKNGETYALVSNGYMLSNDSGNLSTVRASVGGAEIIENRQYTSSLTDVNKSAQWNVVDSDSGLLINNKGYYITSDGECSVSENDLADVSVKNSKLYLTDDVLSVSENGEVSLANEEDASDFEVYTKTAIEPVEEHYTLTVNAARSAVDLTPTGSDLLIKKYIDYLGDGGNNPDTDVTGDNLYRLYLEAKGYTEPMDVLVILDASSSMTNVDMPLYGENQKRLVVEDAILNGTIISGDPNSAYGRANAEREFDGVTAQFLSSHYLNKIAVTAYAGGIEHEGESYEQWKDTFNCIQQNWTTISGIPNGGASAKDFYIPVMFREMQYGTNYVSGLMRAQEMLDDSAVKNDGHKKVVLFLTDGYPNRVIDSDGNISDEKVWDTTLQAFTDFHANNPDVEMSLVGISPEATSGGAYDLLTAISRRVEGTYYLANDGDSLKEALFSFMDFCTNVNITDELSDYVDFYSVQPDIVVTMENGFSNEKVVLWENGAETEDNILIDGSRIVDSVGYVAGDGSDHGSVQLALNPAYKLNGDNIFTVSFNVKVSDEAVEQYMDSGYTDVGDTSTDYEGNSTSSGKEGFHSNNTAYASFNLDDEEFTKYYPHPVVQVDIPEYDILLKKLDALNSSPLARAEFDIYRIVSDLSLSTVEIPGSGGLQGVKLEQALISDSNGKITMTGLIPATYALVETKAPDGYNLLTDAVEFSVSVTGSVTSGDVQVQDKGLIIYNEVYYELPHTGGVGRMGLFIMGLSLLMLSLVMIYIQHRRGGLFK